MRIPTLLAITGLPLMALGQTAEPQQSQEQTKETQTTAPAKGKKAEEATKTKAKSKSETGAAASEQSKVEGSAQDVKKTKAGSKKTETGTTKTQAGTSTNASTSTGSTTTVNKTEFRSRHSEVFSLGRHPKEFFIQRYGEGHFRLFGNTYFVFVDGCWVAVDVDGFTYTERIICQGDPDFVVVD